MISYKFFLKQIFTEINACKSVQALLFKKKFKPPFSGTCKPEGRQTIYESN